MSSRLGTFYFYYSFYKLDLVSYDILYYNADESRVVEVCGFYFRKVCNIGEWGYVLLLLVAMGLMNYRSDIVRFVVFYDFYDLLENSYFLIFLYINTDKIDNKNTPPNTPPTMNPIDTEETT